MSEFYLSCFTKVHLCFFHLRDDDVYLCYNLTWRMDWSSLWLCYSACNLIHIKTCNFVMFGEKKKPLSFSGCNPAVLCAVALTKTSISFCKWGKACVKPSV